MEVGVTRHNFESWPPKDHSYHVCLKLTYWLQRRRLLNIFSIGSYVKTKSRHGGHLDFPIGKRFTGLVQDHPMIIPAKSQFNWFGGFWQDDFLNFSQWEHIMNPGSHVEFQISTKNTYLVEDNQWTFLTTDAYPWQKLTWPMASWAKKDKRKKTIYKALHRKLKIEQHELHYKPGVNSGSPAPLVLLYLQTWR